MLVLSRRLGEGIMLGDNVCFTVLRVRGKQVSIGIRAPHTMNILRDEIYQKNYFLKQETDNDDSQKSI